MDRKLSAILAADVVGYSAMMERDEAGTFERLRADRKELFEPEISRHHGHIFKLMGDGMLAEFGSVVDAVECAVSLQRGLAERNASLPESERVRVRIGINLGEVIVEGEDRYGEGVNVAARLEQLAEPGGIWVSGKVAREVERKLAFGFEPMGDLKVKNLAEPVQAYRVVLDPASAGKALAARRRLRSWHVPAAAVLVLALGLAAWWWPWQSTPRQVEPPTNVPVDARPSLVVLPFDNLSDDRAQGYLADGLTEDLTTELARIPGLFVVSRNAAFAYKDKETKPADIARELGVRYLLEGSIRRVGDDIRINAQLIDGSTAGHIWAERFDGKWADVFAMQDKVLSNIAGALELRLVSGQANPNFAGGTSNPAAYDAYLRGTEIYNRPNTPQEFAEAVRLFQQALELDPDFGVAAASLAWAHWDATEPRAQALGMSVDEAFAKIAGFLEDAARHPSPSYYQLVADLLIREHKSDEAVALLHKSVALNPSDPWNYLDLARALIFNGRPQEARDYFGAALRVDPDPGWLNFRHYLTGLAYFGEDRFQDAVGILEKIDMQSPDPWAKFFGVQVLLSAYGHLGRADRIAASMDDFKTLMGERNYEEPNLLMTQQFFVFKNEADTQRLLGGLSKAGVPDVRSAVEADPTDRLTGAEIKVLLFGHEARGRMTAPDVEPYRRVGSADGSVTVTVGSKTREGKSWVQGDFLCNAYPIDLTTCGAVFRNPSGTQELENEYRAIYRWNQFEFSMIK